MTADADRERALKINSACWCLNAGFCTHCAMRASILAAFAAIRAEGEAKVRAEREAKIPEHYRLVYVGPEWLCKCCYNNFGPICTKCGTPNPNWNPPTKGRARQSP